MKYGIEQTPKSRLNTFEEAKNYLFYELSTSNKKLYGRELGINRTKELMRLLGNPQEATTTVHIAGTSGKGSVAYILANIVSSAGKSVGLSVSPHVYDIRERMQINNQLISEEAFVQEVNNLIPIVVEMDRSNFGRPTYYEANLAIAFQIFKKQNLDFVVLETGVGGLYDSTNVITREDKVSVITALGLDHTEVLGNSIEEIAKQKAGIINPNSTCFAIQPELPANQVVNDVAVAQNATIEYIDTNDYTYISSSQSGIEFSMPMLGPDFVFHLPLMGRYQAQNTALAIKTCQYLSRKYDFDLNAEIIQKALDEVKIPARSEIVNIEDRNIVIDGAHNPQKMSAFIRMLIESNVPKDSIIIFSAKKGKDYTDELKEIKKHFYRIIITGFFKDEPNNIFKSEDPATVAKDAQYMGFDVISISEYPKHALDKAIEQTAPGQTIIVTGSIYMIGELHSAMK